MPARDGVETVRFERNLPTPYARYMPYPISGVTYYGVAIFFDRLTNGVHSLGLRTTLNLNKTVGDDMPHLTLSNLPAMVTVSNVVNYPSWEDHVVGTNHVFRAQCAYPNVDWEITVYDVNYDLVNYASGTSTNGVIEWAWDLTDAWGNPRDNVDWAPVFLPEVTYAAGLPRQTNTSIMPLTALDYPDIGAWLTGYQDRVKDLTIKPYFVEAMEAINGAVATATGIPTSIMEMRYGDDAGPDPETAQANRNWDWYELRGLLGNRHIRNFYYFGHGSTNSIGGGF